MQSRVWAGLTATALMTAGCVVPGSLSLVPGEPSGGPLVIEDHRDRQRLRFLVFGDSGTGDPPQWMVAEGMEGRCREAGGCDFALLLGDAIYPRGVRPSREVDGTLVHDRDFADRFERPYDLFGRLDVWIVPGNHDWRTLGSVETEIVYSHHSPRWRMPWNHYPVPKLPDWIRIYGLDSTPFAKSRDPEQLDDARRYLCGADGPADDGHWRIVFAHHPIYTSGPHGGGNGMIGDLERELLEPLIEACDVHVYFAGHDHHQEHLRAPGFDQVIQGAAAWLRRPRARRGGDGVQSVFEARARLGFAIVEATPTTLRLQFFGCDEVRGCEPIHCAVLDREGFADPATRSRPCAGS